MYNGDILPEAVAGPTPFNIVNSLMAFVIFGNFLNADLLDFSTESGELLWINLVNVGRNFPRWKIKVPYNH